MQPIHGFDDIKIVEASNELEQKIMDAFGVFDHSGKQAVASEEIGTILRSLGCCPTRAEIYEVVAATENKETPGTVPLINFLPYMVKVFMEHKLYPASPELLLEAFRYFDKDKRGYLTKERFASLMLEEGDPFTEEEYEDMINIALDPVSGTVKYEYYVNQLTVAPMDVYNLADFMEAERLKVEAATPKKRKLLDNL